MGKDGGPWALILNYKACLRNMPSADIAVNVVLYMVLMVGVSLTPLAPGMLMWDMHCRAICLHMLMHQQANKLFLSPSSDVTLLPQGRAGHEKWINNLVIIQQASCGASVTIISFTGPACKGGSWLGIAQQMRDSRHMRLEVCRLHRSALRAELLEPL